MLTLAKNEFYRYQKWAWLWAILFLCGLTYIGIQRPLLAPHPAFSAINNLLLLGGSFLFGLLQMALHKRKNHWTYLIHRPIATQHIFYALLLAGMGIILVAAIFPWLLAIVSIDAFNVFVVDTRHYVYLVFLFFSMLMVYQIGTLIILNASWGIVLLASLVVVVFAPTTHNMFTQLFPLIVFNIALLYLNVKSFKPDLSRYLSKPLAIGLLSIPMSFTLLLVLLMSTVVSYHLPKQIAGTHPDSNPEKGTLRYERKFSSKDKLDYFLANEESALAKQIKTQAKLADQDFFYVTSSKFPHQGQLHVDDETNLFIRENFTDTQWQFSHDHMLFLGYHDLTQEMIGVLGKNQFYKTMEEVPEDGRFNHVPVILKGNHLMTSTALYRVNIAEKQLQLRYQLQDNEYFVNTYSGGTAPSLNTNKRTIIFVQANFEDEFTVLEEVLSFPRFGPKRNRQLVNAFKLANGYALYNSSANYFGYDQPGAQVYLATYDGDFTLVGERRFTKYNHPAWIRHFEYMMSPSLTYGRSALFFTLSPETRALNYLLDVHPKEFGKQINVLAAIFYVLSLVCILFLCRLHNLSKAQTITWFILVALMSVPALLSFFFLNPFKGVYFKKLKRDKVAVADTLANQH
jgi:hypothetical protein